MIVSLSVCMKCPYFIYKSTSQNCNYSLNSFFDYNDDFVGTDCVHPDIPLLYDLSTLSNEQIIDILDGCKLFDNYMNTILVFELLQRDIQDPYISRKYLELIYLRQEFIDLETVLIYIFRNWNLKECEDLLINIYQEELKKGDKIDYFINLVSNRNNFYDKFLVVANLKYPENVNVLVSFVLYLNLTLSNK